MISDSISINPKGPAGLKTALGFVLFAAIGIALHGILLSVEYRWAKVLDVTNMAGQDAGVRIILVDPPERVRVIRTSDPFIAAHKGAYICLSKRRMVARRWQRYGAALPVYCRNQQRPVPQQSTYHADSALSVRAAIG